MYKLFTIYLFNFGFQQCRDQNGFKCHISSESHQRQLLLFAEKPGQFLYNFSREFERDFMDILKRCHGTKRVFANNVYQEYIKNKVCETQMWTLKNLSATQIFRDDIKS